MALSLTTRQKQYLAGGAVLFLVGAGLYVKFFWLPISQQKAELTEKIEQVEQKIEPHRKAVLASKFGPALRKHVKALQQARETYGPVRLSKA